MTVPAKTDGLPDWETFLRVAKELRHADGWVMEGAEPDRSNRFCDWWCRRMADIDDRSHVVIYLYQFLKEDAFYIARYFGSDCEQQALGDLSRACVAYSRSGETR